MPRKQSAARVALERLYKQYLAKGQLDPPLDELCAALARPVPRGAVASHLYLIRRDLAEAGTPIGLKIRKLMPKWYSYES